MSKNIISHSLLALALNAIVTSALANTTAVTYLSPIVVTSPMSESPLTVITDPKAPRQPLPAHDGADFLKSIPGFSVIRKGGTDGDPIFRGFSGSRLGILLDGQEIYGGCGGRMDPPTAYVYPESYDRVTIHKGPQSVLYHVRKERYQRIVQSHIKRFDGFGYEANSSATFARFGRNDQMANLKVGNQNFYVVAGGTRSDSNDYKDGDGKKIHSRYTRWNTHAAIGWTPDDFTRLELSSNLSDGKATYADRSMDGAKFRRKNIALAFEKHNITPLLASIKANIYRNYIDHVMDNYSLRPNLDNGKSYMTSNPDRTTIGGRITATLEPTDHFNLTVGTDYKTDKHTARMASSTAQEKSIYKSLPRNKDMQFKQNGIFAETIYAFQDSQRLYNGLRIDWHKASKFAKTAMDSKNQVRKTLTSGFLRYENDFSDKHGTYYLGLGHSERFPDYWERNKFEPNNPQGSAFNSVKPEKTTQLDTGINYNKGPLRISMSAFYGRIHDYVLINWDDRVTRNVNARVFGGELDASYQLSTHLQTNLSLSYVHGKNATDNKALAQQPPVELRLGLNYENANYSFGALWRLVAPQERIDIGSGGIVGNGKDIGPSTGFGVLSLNAGWQASKSVLVTAGIDNIFNKTYAEHLSKSGQSAGISSMGLYPTNTRINEPGRTYWLKVQLAFK